MSPMRMFAERSKQPLEYICRTPDLGQETKTKVILGCLKVFWLRKDHSAGHSASKKKKSRQKKRWEDNIKEWTGIDFAQLGQLKTRLCGKRLLKSHPWCPNDLTRLWTD